MNLTRESDLADQLGIAPTKLARMRRERQWPHVKLGRYDVRYTEAQIEQIVELQTVRPGSRPAKSTNGQTARSAARSGRPT